MAVVDTFTRLIFGEESDFSAQEQSIIQALRLVDGNVAGDTLAQMGDYLRSLEVSEMIELVSRVKDRIAEGLPEKVAGSTLPKFRPGGILIVQCGGGAGLFSAMIGGWVTGEIGSQPVLQEIRP